MKDQKISFDEAIKKIDLRIAEFYLQVKEFNLRFYKSSPAKTPSRNIKLVENLCLNLCLQEKRKLQIIYPNKNTQHRYFTKYRNALLQNQLPENLAEVIRYHLRLELADSEARTRIRDERIDLRANNVVLFEAELFLQACQEFIQRSLESLGNFRVDFRVNMKTAEGISSHPDIYTLVIGLLGLTGRRPIEILKTGEFRWVDSRHVLFSGQAKTKNSPQGRDGYQIPVLDDARRIVDGLKMVRRILPLSSWENEGVSKVFAGRIHRQLRPIQHLLFPQSPRLLSVRALRSLYVTTAYDLFNMREKASFNAFAARVLGHSHLDKNTANCYTYYAPRSQRPLIKEIDDQKTRKK